VVDNVAMLAEAARGERSGFRIILNQKKLHRQPGASVARAPQLPRSMELTYTGSYRKQRLIPNPDKFSISRGLSHKAQKRMLDRVGAPFRERRWSPRE
jgi:hypothetical protein